MTMDSGRSKLRAWWTIACVAVVAVITGAACKRPGGTAASAASRPTVWDFSTGEDVSRVNWPKNYSLDRYTLEEPGEIEVVLLGGERHRLTPERVHLARVGDRLIHVSFEFPAMQLDECYKKALDLATEWGVVDTTPIRKWYADRQRDGGNGAGTQWAAARNTDVPRPRGIEVRPSYNPQAQWMARVGFGWPDNDPASVEARKGIEESYRRGHRSSPR